MPSAKASSQDKDRRETLLQRRERILGTKSLRYVQQNQNSGGSAKDKRRNQVLQAQRVHRQRTLDYIDELEAEIFRLRESEAALVSQKTQLQLAGNAQFNAPPQTNIGLNVLIKSLNGQVAPGLHIQVHTTHMPEPFEAEGNVLPESLDVLPNGDERLDDIFNETLTQSPRDMQIFEGLPFYDPIGWASPSPLDLHLEAFDSPTRMLFQNFSESIAPTLVPFDGASNGYRTILIPFAYENELVKDALLAASANQLRFTQSAFQKVAFSMQATAIEKLSKSSRQENYSSDMILSVLAAIVLLLITGMMNGPDAFQTIYGIAKSWMKFMSETQEPIQNQLEKFLRNEIQMIETYAQPMLSGKVLIASTYDKAATPNLGVSQSLNSKTIFEKFFALESAVKQACSIYTSHVFSDCPPENVEELLKQLRDTVEVLPDHLPGESSLAWVYFIGAAESSTHFSRNFFAKRLMGIYERGNAPDVTTSFHLLHLIWNQQFYGGSWTDVLKQMPLIFK